MEEFLKKIENMTDEQKQYMVFLMLYKIKEDDKRDKAYEFLKEKGYSFPKSILLSTIFNVYSKESNYINNVEELKLANENYRDILLKTKNLSKELKLNNSLEISNLFAYLLWNGYFSKDHLLVFQSSKRNMITNHYSLDIMNGIGVCLNFSDMLSDFLNQFSYSTASIMNTFDNNQKRNYSPTIERNIAKTNVIQKIISKMTIPISNISGNHAFTLIDENGKFYVYDATNFMIFDINDKFNCSNVCGTGGCKIKPYFSHFLNNSTKAEEALVSLNMNTTFESPYTRKDFIFTFENCLDLFKDNEYLLKCFYDEICDNIKVINDNTKNIKKLIKENKVQYYKEIKTKKAVNKK